jgi:hypothetical protein
MFNETSLSPYTDFVGNAVAILRQLSLSADIPAPDCFDFPAHLLRQLGRHLAAYDLVTFHHRGANYPDAWLLDLVLREYLVLIDMCPEWFTGVDTATQLRRRALRQACLLHRHYEGHLVPDAPTSPGENARVLPAPHIRVPEEQLVQPHRRHRRLLSDSPVTDLVHGLTAAILTQSVHDLFVPAELAELGIGLFIDRPLGYAKAAGEPDLTPILAHEAFSPSIARRRLKELAMLAQELSLELPAGFFDGLERSLQEMPVRGLPAERLAEPARPTAALADVRRVADDFVIVRTMPGGVRELMSYVDLGGYLKEPPHVVAMVQSPHGPVLGFFDAECRVMCEAVVDESAGFVRRAGIELPAAGLRII